MVSCCRQMACGAVCLDLVISLGMWVTADLRLCDKLGLLVFYSCSWGQLVVQEDLRVWQILSWGLVWWTHPFSSLDRSSLANTNSAAQTGLDSKICKIQHGDAQPMLVIQKRTMYGDCRDRTSLLEDAERWLNICHMRVNGDLSVSLVFGPV